MSYNTKENRTFRINGAVSIDGNDALFVQGMNIAPDANVFQRDSIGTGTSVFTQNGDVIGSFSFSLKNTVDLFDPVDPPVSDETISKWMASIGNFDPSIINFVQTFNAPKSTGDKFARIVFTGRVIKPEIDMSVADAIENVTVDGELITLTSAKREAS